MKTILKPFYKTRALCARARAPLEEQSFSPTSEKHGREDLLLLCPNGSFLVSLEKLDSPPPLPLSPLALVIMNPNPSLKILFGPHFSKEPLRIMVSGEKGTEQF